MDETEILAELLLRIQEIKHQRVVMLGFVVWYVQRRRRRRLERETDSSEESETMSNESDDDSVCQPIVSRIEGRKRKREYSDDGNDRVYECLTSCFRRSEARLAESYKLVSDISKRRIELEQNMSNAREKVFGEVDKIAGLTPEEKVSASRHLVNKDEELEYFFSLPDDARVVLVKIILAERSL